MSAGAIVRPMRDDDREAVIDLLWELNRYEDGISHDRATARGDAVACLEQTSRRLSAAPGGAMLVAEEDGGIVVGFGCVIFDEGSAFVRAPLRRHAVIVELVVTERWRGRGIGRRLIEHCESLTREAGLPVLAIGVLVGNEPAEQLYRSAGFQPHALELLKRL